MGQVQSCFGLQDDCLPRIKRRVVKTKVSDDSKRGQKVPLREKTGGKNRAEQVEPVLSEDDVHPLFSSKLRRSMPAEVESPQSRTALGPSKEVQDGVVHNLDAGPVMERCTVTRSLAAAEGEGDSVTGKAAASSPTRSQPADTSLAASTADTPHAGLDLAGGPLQPQDLFPQKHVEAEEQRNEQGEEEAGARLDDDQRTEEHQSNTEEHHSASITVSTRRKRRRARGHRCRAEIP